MVYIIIITFFITRRGILRGIAVTYLLLLCHEASVMLVREEWGFVEGRGSKSFIVGVG
jgi:hypothetical protein